MTQVKHAYKFSFPVESYCFSCHGIILFKSFIPCLLGPVFSGKLQFDDSAGFLLHRLGHAGCRILSFVWGRFLREQVDLGFGYAEREF